MAVVAKAAAPPEKDADWGRGMGAEWGVVY